MTIGKVLLVLIMATFVSGARSADKDIPHYKNDPSWPKPFPNHWVIGQIGGLFVDPGDHIWVLQRPLPPALSSGGPSGPPPLPPLPPPLPPLRKPNRCRLPLRPPRPGGSLGAQPLPQLPLPLLHHGAAAVVEGLPLRAVEGTRCPLTVARRRRSTSRGPARTCVRLTRGRGEQRRRSSTYSRGLTRTTLR